jgi:PPK2 family polyphosphate:nucleotide phosphotransferase
LISLRGGATLTAMRKLIKGLRVRPGDDVDLKRWSTRIEPVYTSKAGYRQLLDKHVKRLSELQGLLYASNRHALLIIFQAMDAAGKDGAIKHVMSGVNPQGCQVTSFAHPSATELKHDFMWRSGMQLPERGKIGIFKRSYYEEVLIVRVHKHILAAENLPDDGDDERIWKERYQSINDFERHMRRNGTRIVKIFLHLSKEEQAKRLIERIDEPDKNWKFQSGDVEERKHWKQYRKAYETCLGATSTGDAPWHVVPADDKLTARLLVSEIILEAMEELDMSLPPLTEERKQELARLRKELQAE